MDAVLGLSMTPTTVGLVLVEGQDADGATMDHDEFAVHDRGLVGAVNTSEKATAAVMRTEAVAAANGHRLHSIGVTWSEDADTEASLLLESLSESGFDNVVAVRLPEATEALARGIGSVIDYEITAVCVIEPDAVIVLVVNAGDGTVQTAISHAVRTDEDLARWLSAIFAQADWQPEALVLVGSGSDLDAITPHLEEVLAVPVFVPAEAQLALARGAALASAHGADFIFDGVGEESGSVHTAHRGLWPVSHVGAAMTMLIVGVVTFVVSGSLAIGLRLTSGEAAKPAEQRPAANNTSETPAALQPVPPAPIARPLIAEAAPALPPPPPVAEVQAPAADVALAPAPASEPLAPPAPPEVAYAEGPQAPAPALVPIAPHGVAPVPQPEVAPIPQPGVAAQQPAVIPAPVEPVQERPGILRRIKDRLSGIGRNDEPPQQPALDVAPPPQAPAPDMAPPPEQPVPPPEDPLLLPPPP